MLKYAIPFVYFVTTRTKNVFQFVSWVCIYLVPVALLTLLYAPGDALQALLCAALGVLGVFCIYEFGYMENDAFSVEMESDPTERLTPDQRKAVRKALPYLFIARYAILALVLTVTQRVTGRAVVPNIVALAVLQVCFLAYNRSRSKLGLPLFFVLVGVRYAAPNLTMVPEQMLMHYLLVVSLLYPLPNVLEWARKERYRLPALRRVIRNVDAFRVVYYVVLATSAWGLFAWRANVHFRNLAVVGGYLLAYRLAAFVTLRRMAGLKGKLPEWNR